MPNSKQLLFVGSEIDCHGSHRQPIFIERRCTDSSPKCSPSTLSLTLLLKTALPETYSEAFNDRVARLKCPLKRRSEDNESIKPKARSTRRHEPETIANASRMRHSQDGNVYRMSTSLYHDRCLESHTSTAVDVSISLRVNNQEKETVNETWTTDKPLITVFSWCMLWLIVMLPPHRAEALSDAFVWRLSDVWHLSVWRLSVACVTR